MGKTRRDLLHRVPSIDRLDRQSQHRGQLGGRKGLAEERGNLVHPEGAVPFRGEINRDQTRLSPQFDSGHRPVEEGSADDVGRTQAGMSCKSDLMERSEDSHRPPFVFLLRGEDKHRFREVDFVGNPLHHLSGQSSFAEENRQGVPGIGGFREDIDKVEPHREFLLFSLSSL